MPPALLLRKPVGVSSSRCSLPRCAAEADAGADLHGFHGVDAHHGVREVGIEPVEHRLAQARRHAARHHRDLRADRIALAADLPHEVFELRHARGIRAEERIVVGRLAASPARCVSEPIWLR